MRPWRLLLPLLAIAVVLFALPSRFEGPVLVPISPGHGLSLVDVAAVVPLVAGTAILATALIRDRDRLEAAIRRRPWRSAGVLFLGGAGLGLLFASVFPFFWWWAIGAALLTGSLVVAALTAAGRVRDG